MMNGPRLSLAIFNALTGAGLGSLPFSFDGQPSGMTPYAQMTDAQKKAVQSLTDTIALQVITELQNNAAVSVPNIQTGSSTASGTIS